MVALSTFRRIESAGANLDTLFENAVTEADDGVSVIDDDEQEEEMSWTNVADVLDTFFFLVFLGGQATLSVFFLVPLVTGPS
jgi:hypothetical protein